MTTGALASAATVWALIGASAAAPQAAQTSLGIFMRLIMWQRMRQTPPSEGRKKRPEGRYRIEAKHQARFVRVHQRL
jgi:hypothetical protein